MKHSKTQFHHGVIQQSVVVTHDEKKLLVLGQVASFQRFQGGKWAGNGAIDLTPFDGGRA